MDEWFELEWPVKRGGVYEPEFTSWEPVRIGGKQQSRYKTIESARRKTTPAYRIVSVRIENGRATREIVG